jgi:branched-chain amino acid transport system permease protein
MSASLPSSLSILPFLVNGVSLGLGIALVGLAMALIWRTVGLIDFGLGAVYLVVGYALVVFTNRLGVALWLAIPAALAVGVAAALALYGLVYRAFIHRGAPLFVMVLVGISVFMATQNLISALASPQKFYVIQTMLPGFELLGTRINMAQLARMGISLLALAGVAAFCLRTAWGSTILAVADNKRLAQGVGIHLDHAYSWTYAIAGLVVGLAAIPDVAEAGADPFIAQNPVFLALAAIIIGGLGSFKSPVLGAVLLGLAFHLAVWVLPASWQDVVAYGFVLAVLVARPQGLFGGMAVQRERA